MSEITPVGRPVKVSLPPLPKEGTGVTAHGNNARHYAASILAVAKRRPFFHFPKWLAPTSTKTDAPLKIGLHAQEVCHAKGGTVSQR
jgi:hypothetical protein